MKLRLESSLLVMSQEGRNLNDNKGAYRKLKNAKLDSKQKKQRQNKNKKQIYRKKREKKNTITKQQP